MALYLALVTAVHAALFAGPAPAPAQTPAAAMPSWLAALGLISAGIAAATGIIAALWKVGQLARRVGHFLDDWNGEPERPGIPARPGVLERLAAVEVTTQQLTPNGGAHVADAVRRVEEHLKSAQDVPNTLIRIGGRLDRIEQHLHLVTDESPTA